MPTYIYSGGMTDERAMKIIMEAFPKWPWLKKPKLLGLSVHSLCDAMLYARIQCKSESAGKCIRWAYEQSRKRRKMR